MKNKTVKFRAKTISVTIFLEAKHQIQLIQVGKLIT